MLRLSLYISNAGRRTSFASANATAFISLRDICNNLSQEFLFISDALMDITLQFLLMGR